MIITFKNKGLQILFLDGKSAKIYQSHVKKLRLILAKLNTATCVSDMNFPGSRLHQLRGEKEGFWAVSVNGNRRLIFRFSGENAYDVDYLDYH
jgi:toxin HigB-1